MRDLSLREASVKWFGKPYTAYTTRPDASRRARAQVELVRPGARLSQGARCCAPTHARTAHTQAGRRGQQWLPRGNLGRDPTLGPVFKGFDLSLELRRARRLGPALLEY